MKNDKIKTHPVQTHQSRHEAAEVPEIVSLKAYEVYCALYGTQEALITGSCRGGFATSELIAFLYAGTFPKEQWKDRVREAFDGMTHL